MPSDTTDDAAFADDERFVAASELLDSRVGDEEVLLDVDSGTYYGLNPVGAHLWEELQEPRSVGDLVDATAGEFEQSPETVRGDVEGFLRDMLAAELVERDG